MEMEVKDDTTPPGTGTNNGVNDPGPFSCGRVRAVHFPGGSKVKHAFEPTRIRMASWNIGTMTGKSLEIEEMMLRRRLDVLCVQETKWKNTACRARFLDPKTRSHKLFYYGTEQGKNGVGIILKAELTGGIISITKPSDRLISIKLVINKEIWNVISPYAPQIGCEQAEKDAFWYDFHALLKDMPKDELIFVGGDLNGHVGQSGEDYEDCHGGKGFGTRNPPGEEILALCKSYGLIVLNTLFVKQPRHLVTYSSGGNETQIDYHLLPSFAKRRVKDCKVILGESLATQHRLLVSEFFADESIPKRRKNGPEKIKWQNLNKEGGEKFVGVMQEYLLDILALDEDHDDGNLSVQEMWNYLQDPCLERAKTLLGASRNRNHIIKETWWWSKEAKEVVRAKKDAFQAWSKCPWSDKLQKKELHNAYKQRKKVAKRVCAQMKAAGSEELYKELDNISPSAADRDQTSQELHVGSKYAETTIFKLTVQRRINANEIDSVKFIQDENGKFLTNDDRWTDPRQMEEIL